MACLGWAYAFKEAPDLKAAGAVIVRSLEKAVIDGPPSPDQLPSRLILEDYATDFIRRSRERDFAWVAKLPALLHLLKAFTAQNEASEGVPGRDSSSEAIRCSAATIKTSDAWPTRADAGRRATAIARRASAGKPHRATWQSYAVRNRVRPHQRQEREHSLETGCVSGCETSLASATMRRALRSTRGSGGLYVGLARAGLASRRWRRTLVGESPFSTR